MTENNSKSESHPSLPSPASPTSAVQPKNIESDDYASSASPISSGGDNGDGGEAYATNTHYFDELSKLPSAPTFAASVSSVLPSAHILHKFEEVVTKNGDMSKEWRAVGYHVPTVAKVVRLPAVQGGKRRRNTKRKKREEGEPASTKILCAASVRDPETGSFRLAVAEYGDGKMSPVSLQDNVSLGEVTPRPNNLRLFHDSLKVPLCLTPASAYEGMLFSYFPPGVMPLYLDPKTEDTVLLESVKNFVADRWAAYKGVYGTLSALLILATYIRETFATSSWWHVACTGKVGTGKSSLIMLMDLLAFLAVDLASITGAATAETDHLYHPTFLLDECQTLNEKSNPDNAMKLAVLVSRYKKGSKRVKMSDPTPWEARRVAVNELAGYTVLAGTQLPISLALNDRIIPFPSIYAQPVKPVDDSETLRESMNLRARLLAFRFRHLFDDVEAFLSELRQWKRTREDGSEVYVRGRIREIAAPLLYIARCCGTKEQEQEVKAFLEDLDAKKENESALSESADVLDAYVLTLFDAASKKENYDIQVKEISEKLNSPLPEPKHKQPGEVGSILKSMGFSRYKRSGKRVEFDAELLTQQLKTYGLEIPKVLSDILPHAPVGKTDTQPKVCEKCGKFFRVEDYGAHVSRGHPASTGTQLTFG